ncbi:MAG: ergothioneine biosynthesis protein EgtB [Sphingopyxis sp.]|nr:ergothioneine biosynthesis protein EgtB [Sphingopyxis sp.]
MASRTDVSNRTDAVADLAGRFAATRRLSLDLVATLSDADASAQSMPDASPAKWHLAHTTWFFETFVLRDHVPGYALFDDRYPYLFNSYYEAEGPRHARPQRGLLTRPSLDEIGTWRTHVDAAVQIALPDLPPAARALVELGIHHEQQHQELLLTDIKHLFAQNPIGPAVWAPDRRIRCEVAQFSADAPPRSDMGAMRWIRGAEGVVSVGHDGDDFAFDCEVPRFSALLTPHALASRPVSNGEWRQFIDDGGYHTPALWLSDGWTWVRGESVESPAYWDGDRQFTLAGWQDIDLAAPVTHISFFEADAFATWAGARLPTEFEWEAAAATFDPRGGQQLDAAGPVHPAPPGDADAGLQQMFGGVWEWTGSAYRPYPGFRAAPGAVGEYNGKFMSGQFVLRGGSCATPRGHVRASYRNFFYPHQRWQFTGVRLAKDLT